MAEPEKKFEYPTEAHAEADILLGRAAIVTAALEMIQEECRIEVAALAAKHNEKSATVKKELEILGKQIAKFAKKHQADLFEGRDRIDLFNGALLHQEDSHVVKPRGVDMLARLKELGITDGIKITEMVDWDSIEEWSGERLIEIGTERRKSDRFAYELYSQEPSDPRSKSKRKDKK